MKFLVSNATRQALFGTLAAAATLTAGARAGAVTVNCTADIGGTVQQKTLTDPVVIKGSSAARPLVRALAPLLASAATPVALVYQSGGSCTGVDALVNGTPATGTDAEFQENANTKWTCTLNNVTVDIGLSDVFPKSCSGITDVPFDVVDHLGPVQSMTFIVPTAAQNNSSISAEAAYLTFGLGQAGGTPWNDETQLHVRNAGSGTQTMLGLAIGVPATRWIGKDEGGSPAMVTAVGTSVADPNKVIGILASNEADANRATLKVLAYQHYGQSCGYWPDSSPSAHDKLNVRIGRYPVWGPIHMLARAGANASVIEVVKYLSLEEEFPANPTALLDVAIAQYTTPPCAMQVTRSEDLGPITSYPPPKPCGCYFDFKAGATTCQTCVSDTECATRNPATPTCRYGYCEVK